MTNKDDQKPDKRYLKKFEIVETEVELPIQGQVRDPEDLFSSLNVFRSSLLPEPNLTANMLRFRSVVMLILSPKYQPFGPCAQVAMSRIVR